MPTYLCHGFRWHRPSLRIFSILQNLDDVSPDWITRPGSSRALIDALYQKFPFLPDTDVEADAEAEAAALLAAQKAVAAAEERGRKLAEAASVSRSKSKSRKEKKTKQARDAAPDAAAMASISPTSAGASAFAAAAAAMRANIESTPPGKCPRPANPANVPVPEQPGVPPVGVVRRSDGRDNVLALQDRSAIKLLEEYDSDRLDECTRPHVYVADYVARIDLSVSIVDEMARYERLQHQRWRREQKTKDGQPSMAGPADEGPAFAALGGNLSGGTSGSSGGNTLTKKKKAAGWLEMLRDQLQGGEEIRWYIVVNNDEARPYVDGGGDGDGDEEEGEEGEEDDEDYEVEDQGTTDAAWQRSREAERECERRRLRFELTGDPDILRDDWSEEAESRPGEEDESRPATAAADSSTGSGPTTTTTTTATTTTTTTTPTPTPSTTNTADSGSTPMVFPLPPQPEPRRPHTSAAASGQTSEISEISDSFWAGSPSPPQLVVSSPSRQLPQRQSLTPNFSTPHSPPTHQQHQQHQQHRPPMPPIPTSPPILASPTAPQLRSKKSFDLRPKASGGGGFRRLFARSKQDP